MKALKLYFKLIKISMQSRLQYRGDFFAGIVSVIILNSVSLGLISILVRKFNNLNGWSIWELFFLYSLWVLGHSLYSLFFWHFNTMEEYIIQGTFDQFLIRPISPMLQFLGREIQYMGIGDVIVGIVGLTLAYINLDLSWGIEKWILLILFIFSGTLIETSISWIIASCAFWTGRSLAAFSLFLRLNVLIQQYPIEIFGKWFRVAVTSVIPIAFINYYPSLLLLDKKQSLGKLSFLTMSSPLVSLVLFGLAILVWRKAIKSYTSSGN